MAKRTKKAPAKDPPAAAKPLTVNQLIRRLFAVDAKGRGEMKVVIFGQGGAEYAASAREQMGDSGDGAERVFLICGEGAE